MVRTWSIGQYLYPIYKYGQINQMWIYLRLVKLYNKFSVGDSQVSRTSYNSEVSR